MKSLISISLALIVLFSTIGMAKTTHFCMGHEMKSEIGFSQKHLDCGMNMQMNHSENESDNQNDPESCCKNITEQLQVDDDVQLKKVDIKLDINFAVSLVHIFFIGADIFSNKAQEFPQYNSPPPTQELHILYESLLI
ncbi:HYC_CC_PP family protein [Algoriphagus sp.]|uniref:HYC_CC_PP family protein n=1 Tax=Algoriphagus sp. TaxID=1872435 RepID=UPI00391894AE